MRFPSSSSSGRPRMSLSRVLSYVFDWVVIIAFAIVGGLFTLISPYHRVFSLADPDISFPYDVHETISTLTLVLVALVAPAIIIALICLLLVPGPTVPKGTPKGRIWRRKLWEWNTGWMGLGLSLAMAFLVTDGMKILFGKQRPDFLSRCQPDLSNVQKYAVGGLGEKVLEGQYLVDWSICKQTDMSILRDGFQSFPSGHSSLSWAGLLYLSLFVCSKFAIAIPYLLPASYSSRAFSPQNRSQSNVSGSGSSKKTLEPQTISEAKALRSEAAAPPVYLLVLALVPLGAATYIVSTRYSNYRHHGFDLIFGSLIGIVTSWVSFRWYHAPIQRGAGWSWGPRSNDRAWAVGVGVQGYAGIAEWKKRDEEVDLESGSAGGMTDGLEEGAEGREV